MKFLHRYPILLTGLILFCGLLLCASVLTPGLVRLLSAPSTATPDFAATIQALIPTYEAAPTPATPSPVDGPSGHIVFTCQLFKYQVSEQICIMNADGSGYQRLTSNDDVRHFYPSLSPDGKTVVYSSLSTQSRRFEIYELNLATGAEKSLTYAFGDLNGPEISPDGTTIVFTRYYDDPNDPNLWLMDRAGGNLRQVSGIAAWDPTWSPDGKQILFASDRDGTDQLYVINVNGSGLRKITSLPALRGRSDWSPDGKLIVTYSGKPWMRELYIMNADGSNLHQLSPSGGNSQGPSFSPDGQWVTFTAYFDHPGDIYGCEIYIIRIDGSDMRRLTNDDYCDYQPRWGP